MGIARSTYYDRSEARLDDTALLQGLSIMAVHRNRRA